MRHFWTFLKNLHFSLQDSFIYSNVPGTTPIWFWQKQVHRLFKVVSRDDQCILGHLSRESHIHNPCQRSIINQQWWHLGQCTITEREPIRVCGCKLPFDFWWRTEAQSISVPYLDICEWTFFLEGVCAEAAHFLAGMLLVLTAACTDSLFSFFQFCDRKPSIILQKENVRKPCPKSNHNGQFHIFFFFTTKQSISAGLLMKKLTCASDSRCQTSLFGMAERLPLWVLKWSAVIRQLQITISSQKAMSSRTIHWLLGQIPVASKYLETERCNLTTIGSCRRTFQAFAMSGCVRNKRNVTSVLYS